MEMGFEGIWFLRGKSGRNQDGFRKMLVLETGKRKRVEIEMGLLVIVVFWHFLLLRI